MAGYLARNRRKGYNMRNILTIINNCRKRNWAVIIICIGLGLFMGLIQQFLGNNFNEDLSKMDIALVDHEDTKFSRELARYLEVQLNMKVTISHNYENHTEDLLDRELSAIIELEAGYYEKSIVNGKALPIEITTVDNYANEAYLKSYLNAYLKSMDLIFQSANGNQEMADQMISDLNYSDVKVVGADKLIQEKSANYSGFTLTTGFYLNFMWIIGLFLGLIVMSDRLDGTYLRIQGTPVKGFQYMLGTVSYYILVGLLVPIFYIGVLKVRGIDVGVNYWIVALLFVIINIFVIGISTIFSLLIRSKVGVVIGIYSFGAVLAILGGAYFDLEGIAGSLEKIYRLTPTYWFMDCIRSSQSDLNFNPTLNLVILSLSAILSLLIAGVLYNRQIETKE